MALPGEAALEESKETKSLTESHLESWNGNVKAMPGYDKMYNPCDEPDFEAGGIYSPGNAGPINLL